VVVDELKSQARRRILSARADWQAEREAFLSDKPSQHTRAAYARALQVLEAWLQRRNLALTDLSALLADDFIRDIRAQGYWRSGVEHPRDADTVRAIINAASSFYTFLERRFEEIKNPFRGTRARPLSTWETARIPTPQELQAIRAALDEVTRAALEVILETGLRIGGLPEMTIREDGSFYTTTKGRRFQGFAPLEPATRKALRAAHLDPCRPFAPELFPATRRRTEGPLTAGNLIALLKMRLQRACEKLLVERQISASFSWHDFRHAYAQTHLDRGMAWLRDRLGHASIAITERYLRNVLAVDTREMQSGKTAWGSKNNRIEAWRASQASVTGTNTTNYRPF
jgi:site-specific recombinase XerD